MLRQITIFASATSTSVPYGILLNYPIANVSKICSLCFQYTYSHAITSKDLDNCVGPWLFVGTLKTPDASTFLQGAFARRVDGLAQTFSSTIAAGPYNGAYWHRIARSSFGFSPSSDIHGNSSEDQNAESRLIWPLDNSDGEGRAENIRALGQDSNHQKVLMSCSGDEDTGMLQPPKYTILSYLISHINTSQALSVNYLGLHHWHRKVVISYLDLTMISLLLLPSVTEHGCIHLCFIRCCHVCSGRRHQSLQSRRHGLALPQVHPLPLCVLGRPIELGRGHLHWWSGDRHYLLEHSAHRVSAPQHRDPHRAPAACHTLHQDRGDAPLVHRPAHQANFPESLVRRLHRHRPLLPVSADVRHHHHPGNLRLLPHVSEFPQLRVDR